MTNTIDDYSLLTAPAADDLVLIWDTSAGATKKARFDAFDIDFAGTFTGASVLASPASGDLLLIYDVSTTTVKSLAYSTLTALLSSAVAADGSVALTADWDIGVGRKIQAEQIRARSSGGLGLAEDGGAYGLFIQDSTGFVGVGTGNPSSRLTVSGTITTTALTASGAVSGGNNTDTTSYLGRAAIGYDGSNSDFASFAHVDQNAYNTFALTQTAAGLTLLNAASGQRIGFEIAALEYAAVDSTAFYPAVDASYDLGKSGNRWRVIRASGAIYGAADSDTASYFGRAAIGYDGLFSDSAIFAHIDQYGTAGAAVKQSAAGITTINAANGQPINFGFAGGAYYQMDTTGFLPTTDDARDLGGASNRWDDVYATNGTIQTSDERQKVGVAPSDLGLAFIRQLEPIRYRFRDRQRPHYGLSAQQVRGALDALGVDDFAGYIHDERSDSHGLRMGEFIAPIIAALQELATRLEALEA